MSDSTTPSTTLVSGRFTKGNKAAAGHSSRSQKLRGAILASISREDVQAITATLVDQAKAGDLGAAKLLLSFIGKPTEGPAVAIQVNGTNQTPSHSPGRDAGVAEHAHEPVAPENFEAMRAELMSRIGQSRDATDTTP